MANILEKFYNKFLGLDTRSNKLIQDAGVFRNGSKNWRQNFQDEIQQANGFNHCDQGTEEHSQGLIEYRYRDVSTGESKSQLLGVDDDGNLNRKLYHVLKFTPTVPDLFIPYSFFYNEVTDKFNLVIESNTIEVTKTMTMSQLATAINAVLVSGTVAVYDQDGVAVVGSTKLAYLGNCVINLDVFSTDFFHQSWYWEQVPTPTSSEVLFPTTVTFKDDPDYEGISYINQNNSVYITDGGFPIKYDGFTAYRAGMPRTAGNPNDLGASFDGFVISGTAGGLLSPSATYQAYFQYGYIDPSGSEILGKTTNPLTETLTAGESALSIQIPAIKNTAMFPVYACKVDAQFILSSTNQTFNVDAGHNILVGMVLRIPVINGPTGFPGISFWYPKVTSTTATTITVQAPPVADVPGLRNYTNTAFTVVDNQWINGGFTDEINHNRITEPILKGGTYMQPDVLAGAFVRYYRTTANTDVFNRAWDLPAPLYTGTKDTWVDDLADTGVDGLSQIAFSSDDGAELPRACKYLSEWQGFMVQAGRPVNTALKDVLYPTTYETAVSAWGTDIGVGEDFKIYNSEAMLCDFSSFYWADIDDVEGFPQDGLHEFLLNTVLNDRITGVYPNKDSLFVFKQKNTGLASGDVALNQISVEILEAEVGCVSHRSIQEVRGALIWLDGSEGFYSCIAGRLPEPVGYRISDVQKINADRLKFYKAVAANFREESMYVCAIEDQTFVFDYGEYGVRNRTSWYFWDRFNTKAIIATSDGELVLSDGTQLWKMKTTNTKYDMTDDVNAISFEVRTGWLNQAFPTVDKHFVKFWINSIQGDFSLAVDQYHNYLEAVVGTISGVDFLVQNSSKKAVKEEIKLNNTKAVALSVGMRHATKNKFVRIQGYELQLSADYDKGEPTK